MMQASNSSGKSVHRRYDPLSGRWVLNSPHRLRRPWTGQIEQSIAEENVGYDDQCYLCPANERASGIRNPAYSGVWSFDNDFPAVLPEQTAVSGTDDPLFRSEQVRGEARVVCFSPNHSRRLSRMDSEEIVRVLRALADECRELGSRWKYVQLFENRGEMMGCSNPHPHAQIWATSHVPDLVRTENDNQRSWLAAHGKAMLAALAEREGEGSERLIYENEHWLAIVPWWAQWPFETLILPWGNYARLDQVGEDAISGLAALLARLMPAYDRLFDTPFPYSMGWHGAPYGTGPCDHWRVHAHVYPPLLRSATVRKFMVGYELLAEAQRDLTPETAAAMLRDKL